MRPNSIQAGLMLTMAAGTTSVSQAQPNSLPIRQLVQRGLGTGFLSEVAKQGFGSGSNASKANQQSLDLIADDFPDIQFSESGKEMSQLRRSVRTIACNLAANSLGMVGVGRLTGERLSVTRSKAGQLILPLTSMELTNRVLEHSNLPPVVKKTLAYSAFWATGVAQGKEALSHSASVAAFVAGSSAVRWVASRVAVSSPAQSEKGASSGVVRQSASGFLNPNSSRIASKADSASRDSFIRSQYHLTENQTLWEGPDGSVFLPLN
ncbi:MAG: hypothetical protein R3194_11770 [Limnobacter sp.]|nr:hypothetical protein [Limnobacter sp.]